MSFTLISLLATLVLGSFVLYYLGIFGILLHCCPENRLCLIVLSVSNTSLLLSLPWAFWSHYLFFIANLCRKV